MSVLFRNCSILALLGLLVLEGSPVRAQEPGNRAPQQGKDSDSERLVRDLLVGLLGGYYAILGIDLERELTWRSGRSTPANDREKEMGLNRPRRNHSLTEIASGQPHNVLLQHLAREQGRGRRGPHIDLDEALLRRISVAPEGAGGSMGLLRDGGADLPWPASLRRAEFGTARKALEQALSQAVQEARTKGRISYAVHQNVLTAQTRLSEALDRKVKELTPTEYVQARRFLNQLNEPIKALSHVKAGNFFNQKWTARGKTVAELVEHVSREGLKIAPAAPGDEEAYRKLLNALTAYDAGNTQGAARPVVAGS